MLCMYVHVCLSHTVVYGQMNEIITVAKDDVGLRPAGYVMLLILPGFHHYIPILIPIIISLSKFLITL